MRLEILLGSLEEMGLEEAATLPECPSMKDHMRILEIVSTWMRPRP